MCDLTPVERMRVAREAQARWAVTTFSLRSRVLRRLRQQISAQSEQIVELLCRETGKPALDALAGDVLVTLEQMRYYEKHAARLLKPRKISRPAFLYMGARFYEQYEPHGVVLIYSPTNYPFQLSVVPMITALFAGNAAIVKCSEKTPHVARLIAALCRDAELPEGLVQLVHDQPLNAASYIDASPDLVFFTGSTEHGRAVAKRCAERLIPSVLELGGKDAALVFADCNLERTVEGVAYGAFSNSGQVCVGIKRAYIQNSIYVEFCRKLTERVQQLRTGSSTDSDLGQMQGESTKQTLISQVDDAVRRGATVLFPQSEIVSGDTPILLSDVPGDSRLLLEETFGPVLCVTPFQDETEAVALANSTQFALSASVWTRDILRGRRVASAMAAGSCAVNDAIRNIANPYGSFGGNRESGYGRYHGPQGLYTFSRSKSLMILKSNRGREIHWFPFAPKTFKTLIGLLEFRHSPSGWRNAIRRFLLPCIVCALISTCLRAEDHEPPRLSITVDIASSSHGSIGYLIFASPDGFPDKPGKAMRGGFIDPPGSGHKLTFDAGPLPPGRYAVSVYQDVNGNRRLDRNILGIPKEPVGTSNNPKPSMGAPRFEDCAFQMKDSSLTISIAMVKDK